MCGFNLLNNNKIVTGCLCGCVFNIIVTAVSYTSVLCVAVCRAGGLNNRVFALVTGSLNYIARMLFAAAYAVGFGVAVLSAGRRNNNGVGIRMFETYCYVIVFCNVFACELCPVGVYKMVAVVIVCVLLIHRKCCAAVAVNRAGVFTRVNDSVYLCAVKGRVSVRAEILHIG